MPKLTGVLHGPHLSSDEGDSTDARNLQFELTFASILSRPGLPLRLGENPDLTIQALGKAFLIECKNTEE
jgi:hypothetical protein